MPPRKKSKKEKDKEIDPEVLMRQKFRAKCRFRALVRLAMANARWLIAHVDTYEGDDVRKRVQKAVRRKKKELLSLEDKALLNKPAEDRTDQEKKYIYHKIGGLKCFKRYPNIVKKRLAAVTYFKYYGPNRVIVRQHQEAHAMYFIVSGKVEDSQMMYDELTEENVSVVVGRMESGGMFGEASLLHDIPRTTTVTTTDHCELLMLKKEDFKRVLHHSLQKDWDEIEEAMSMFTYFDQLDRVAKREGCIVAKIKHFMPNEIILGDDQGVPNHVYFILSGECQMIESLKCIVTKMTDHTYFTLYDPFKSVQGIEEDLDKKYASVKSQSMSKGSRLYSDDEFGESQTKHDEFGESQTKHDEFGESKKKSFLLSKSDRIADESIASSKTLSKIVKSKPSVLKKGSSKKVNIGVQESVTLPQRSKSRLNVEYSNPVLKSQTHSRLSSLAMLEESLHKLKFDSRVSSIKTTSLMGLIPEFNNEKNIKTFFMQVVQYKPGSTFGFGENMRDRRIVALTPMRCMLIPKVWLLQHNTANIWTRIEYYLEKKIPRKAKLFKELVSQMNWRAYRDMLVEDIVSTSTSVNYTSVHDVPYSIRLEEMFDI